MSEEAVRKGIKALVDLGIIRRFTVKVGLSEGAEAITLLSNLRWFKNIKENPNVETIYEITGQYDIAVIIFALNIAEVARLKPFTLT